MTLDEIIEETRKARVGETLPLWSAIATLAREVKAHDEQIDRNYKILEGRLDRLGRRLEALEVWRLGRADVSARLERLEQRYSQLWDSYSQWSITGELPRVVEPPATERPSAGSEQDDANDWSLRQVVERLDRLEQKLGKWTQIVAGHASDLYPEVRDDENDPTIMERLDRLERCVQELEDGEPRVRELAVRIDARAREWSSMIERLDRLEQERKPPGERERNEYFRAGQNLAYEQAAAVVKDMLEEGHIGEFQRLALMSAYDRIRALKGEGEK